MTYAGIKLTKEKRGAIKRAITSCRRFSENKYIKEANELLEYYRGRQWSQTPGTELPQGQHRIVVNKVLTNIELKCNAVAFHKPEFIVNPRNEKGELNKNFAKAGCEYYFEHGNFMRQFKAALKDSKIVRYGAVRVSWKFETDEIITQDTRYPVDDDAPPSMADAAEAASSGEDLAAEVMEPISREVVYCDEPVIERIRPTDLFLDPAADWDIENCRFVCYRETVPLDDVKANPRYNPRVVKRLKGNCIYKKDLLDEETQKIEKDEDYPSDLKSVELWHFYEKRTRIHCLFADEYMEEELLAENFPWKFKGYPFVLIIAHEIPDKSPAECLSDIDLTRPLSDSNNQIRSLQQHHIEQFSAKHQVKNGTLTPNAKRQLASSVSGIVVEHNGQQDDAIRTIQVPNIQPEVYRMEEKNARDMVEMTGVSDYMMSNFPDGGRKTATEVAALQQTGSGRIDSDVIAFSEFIAAATKKMLALMQQYHARTQTIPITDPETNRTTWAEFSRDEISGEYDLQIEIGSTQAKNQEAVKQDWLMLGQTLAPLLQAVDPLTNMPVINTAALVKHIVEAFGMKNASDILLSTQMQPAPMDPTAAPTASPVGPDPMQAMSAILGGGMPQMNGAGIQ